MKRLFVFVLITFLSLSAFSTAKFPNITMKPLMVDSRFAQSGNRADFTWDWEGPEAGIIRHLVIDPTNNNLGLAISDGGHLWRTVDGTSWILVQDFQYDSPTDVLYTASNIALVVCRDTLFYTVDGGNNWLVSPYPFLDIDGLSEQGNSTVYLSGDVSIQGAHAIYRSADFGLNWTVVDTILDHDKFFCIQFDPSNDSIIYYGTRYTGGSQDTTVILKSTDMGATWTRIFETNSSFPIIGFMDIEINPYDGNEIFVSCGFEAPGTGPLYSSDGGNTWNWVPGAIAAGLIMPFDVEFADSDTVIVTNMLPPGIFMGIRFAAVGWQFFRTDTLVGTQDVELGSGGTYYCGTAGDGIYKSLNYGFTWSTANTNLRAHLTYSNFGDNASECAGRTLYTSSVYSTPLYKTTNGGLTWQRLYCPYSLFINSIELYPGNPDIVYLGGFGGEFTLLDTLFFSFFRSTDGGQSWTPMDTIPMPPSGPGDTYYSLWVSPTDSSRLLSIYAPMDSIPLFMRSSNSGADWDTILYDVHYTKLTGTDTVFVAADTTLYVSFDKGDNWQPLSFCLPILEMSYNPENHLLYVIRGTGSGDSLGSIDLSGTLTNLAGMQGGNYSMRTPGGNDIYLSTWAGGYIPLFIRSPDGGQSFDVDTLSFLPVNLRATPNEILLADVGLSFRRSSDAVGVSLDEEKAPCEYSLRVRQSVFSKEVTITCVLPKSKSATIDVRSIDGRLVKTLHQGICSQGTHSIVWSGKNEEGHVSPSGIYFIIMHVDGEYIPSRKVIKIK